MLLLAIIIIDFVNIWRHFVNSKTICIKTMRKTTTTTTNKKSTNLFGRAFCKKWPLIN